jgi:hypothetical protein
LWKKLGSETMTKRSSHGKLGFGHVSYVGLEAFCVALMVGFIIFGSMAGYKLITRNFEEVAYQIASDDSP